MPAEAPAGYVPPPPGPVSKGKGGGFRSDHLASEGKRSRLPNMVLHDRPRVSVHEVTRYSGFAVGVAPTVQEECYRVSAASDLLRSL